jgi:fructose-1,6-bisphosphatase/inositol monophosphatase family enzyme
VAALGRVAVAWKGPGDRVTEVDAAIQPHIVKEIDSAFPRDGLMAEEDPRTLSREVRGTLINFARRMMPAARFDHANVDALFGAAR